jgi:putative membrane protein
MGRHVKNLAKNFLSESDRQKIDASVKAAEGQTSGEIVPMVISAGYHYPMADVVGAATFAIPLAIVLTHLLGHWLWIGDRNLWLFLGVAAVLFILFHTLIERIPALKRCFISRREMEEEVEEAAVTRFFGQGLYRTRDETGVLILISVFERKVWVLADRGINARVGEGQWEEIVAMITDGIRQNRPAEAICRAVEKVGEILAEHFPLKPDDTNELRNIIVEE